MPRYWLTTHWPLYVGGTDHHQHVWLQEGTQHAGVRLAPGDKVLIYESTSGRTRLETLADGTERPIPLRPGRQGIVTAADVVGRLSKTDPTEARQKYTDGSQRNWAWKAETGRHISNGFVSMDEVNRVLGYKSGNVLRGFGDGHSGLKEISKRQYDLLISEFRENAEARQAPAPGGRAPPPGHWREGGGEGPEHLLLKQYVAAHPSQILGEEGVETVRVEYPFPTGDQADIVLRDQAGRFIGVEIEVTQRDNQLEGLLQAVKYRHMLAVTEGVQFDESRSVLVAYEIGGKLRNLCAKYDVQFVRVARRAVMTWSRST